MRERDEGADRGRGVAAGAAPRLSDMKEAGYQASYTIDAGIGDAHMPKALSALAANFRGDPALTAFARLFLRLVDFEAGGRTATPAVAEAQWTASAGDSFDEQEVEDRLAELAEDTRTYRDARKAGRPAYNAACLLARRFPQEGEAP